MAHTNSEKIKFERSCLEIALPVLEKLYGNFIIDESQTDKPDAAIILENKKKIGIEIITAETEETKMRLNGTSNARREAVDKVIFGDQDYALVTEQKIMYQPTYISVAAFKKTKKYKDYKDTNKFDEIVLIVASEYIGIRYKHFESCHIPTTQDRLLRKQFPYDKLIYVYKGTDYNGAVLIYEKNKKYDFKKILIRCQFCEETFNQPLSITAKMGRTINLHKIAEERSIQEKLEIERKQRKKKKKS